MKIKLGLKHYDVIKVESLKGKIVSNKINDKIIYYPNTNTINTYFRNNKVHILVTKLKKYLEILLKIK